MRIDKFLSNLKFGTRKEVKDIIRSNRVTVNDNFIKDQGMLIDPNKDIVKIDGFPIYYKEEITLMMNKPKDTVSANTDTLHKTVMDLLEEPYFRFDFNIAGRLDIDTEGFILLTTSGDLLHQVISPNKEVFKTYIAELELPFERQELLEKGVKILDSKNMEYITKPAIVEVLSEKVVSIKIAEGKFHQVKRMFEAIGNNVVSLKRTAIGGLKLDEQLEPGSYRECSEEDILKIFS